jgi:AAA family ATP:ADP antiporter
MQTAPTNPIRALLNIKRSELPLALLMCSYLFLVVTTFWINKPIKKSLFIEFYDKAGFELFGWTMKAAQAELLAKVGNMIVAAAAVVAFTAMSNRLKRHRLTVAFCAFFIGAFALYAVLLPHETDLLVWSFYLFGDLYSTIMVAGFFAFLNDSVTPSAARRLYGVIVLGGVAGGAFGSLAVYKWIEAVSNPGWMAICIAINAAIALAAWLAGRLVERAGAGVEAERAAKAALAPTTSAASNPALDGARLVFRSRYLLAIVAMVAVYEIVSTVLDFQFSAAVAEFLNGPAIGEQYALVFAITNGTALAVQLLLTTWLMSRFSLFVPLLVAPVAVLAGSASFLALPMLWTGSALNTADNAFSYSVNQSSREALYTPTTREEKYKAKAFIDMFVQRFAKSLAVGVTLVTTALFTSFQAVRLLSLFTIALTLVWAFAAYYAGRRFHALAHEPEQADDAPGRAAVAPATAPREV